MRTAGYLRDENYPLLLLVREDGDKKTSFYNRRTSSITNGATTIITQWPNYFNTCWAASVIAALILVVTILMIISSVTTGIYQIPNCDDTGIKHFTNHTIHLVHGPKQWTKGEVDILEKIIKSYPDYHIHLLQIYDPLISMDPNPYELFWPASTEVHEDTKDVTTAPVIPVIRRERRHINPVMKFQRFQVFRSKRHNRSMPQIQTVKVLNENATVINATSDRPIRPPSQILLNRVLKLVRNNSNILAQNISYVKYFRNTPLDLWWPSFNDEVKIFAVRILELWQYGGISFSLDIPHTEKVKGNDVQDFVLFDDDFESLDFEMSNDTNYNDNYLNKTQVEKSPQNLEVYKYEREENRTSPKRKLQPGVTFEEIDEYIEETKVLYESSHPKNVIVDLKGYRIAAKTPCHMIFGEILSYLRRINKTIQVEDIIKRTILILCRIRVIDKEACEMTNV